MGAVVAVPLLAGPTMTSYTLPAGKKTSPCALAFSAGGVLAAPIATSGRTFPSSATRDMVSPFTTGTCIREHSIDLDDRKARIDRNGDDADPAARVHEFEVLGTVGKEECQPVAGVEPADAIGERFVTPVPLGQVAVEPF